MRLLLTSIFTLISTFSTLFAFDYDNSSNEIAGVQFNVYSALVIDAFGGSAEDSSGFTFNFAENMVLGVSMSGQPSYGMRYPA